MKLSKPEKIRLIKDYLLRISYHNSAWFRSVKEKYGIEKAGNIIEKVYNKSADLQLNRIKKIFDQENNFNFDVNKLSENQLDEIKIAIAKNWLANDGIWFQLIEFEDGIFEAKECNDNAWKEFSPFEAIRIKNILRLGINPGIIGLQKALKYRLYNDINVQSTANEKELSFDFFMNECRVQVARNRKGLEDYPCKSAGIIEYSTFAETIDSRIKTKVISCPPDKHPEEWYCGWHFYIE